MIFYEKKYVNAIQYLGKNIQEVIDFTERKFKKHEVYSMLENTSGERIQIGDYVVKNNTEISIYAPHLFEKKFIKEN